MIQIGSQKKKECLAILLSYFINSQNWLNWFMMITTLGTSIDFSNFIFSLLHFTIIIWAQLKESFISNKK
jgi:hypothetical protein